MAIPILAAAIKAAVAKAITDKLGEASRKTIAPDVTAAIVEEVVSNVTKDPVVKNEMNAEAPWQSRVAVGSVVSALGVLAPIALRLFGVDVSAERVVEIAGAVMTLAGAGYAIYGRFRSGLKPLFAGKG